MFFWIKKENFLEFLRNLTPQIVFCAVSMSSLLRMTRASFSWSDFSLFVGFFVIFIWAAGANFFVLMGQIKENLQAEKKEKPGIRKVLIPVLLAVGLLYAGMGVVSYTAIATASARAL